MTSLRRLLILGLCLIICTSVLDNRLAAQAIADDEILPDRQMPSETAKPKPPVATTGGAGALSAITVAFVKADEILPAGVMFFNVFKIQNTGAAPISFTPEFSIPPRTNLMLQEADKGELQLNPGESKFMPVRVSFPTDAEGGVQFEVTGVIMGKNGEAGQSATAKIEFERSSRWQISTPLSKVYASSISTDFTAVNFMLRNRGNAAEKLNLFFEAGELLKMEGGINGTMVLDFVLRPSTDTVIVVNILSKPYEGDGSAGDKARLQVLAKNHPDSAGQDVVVIFDTKEGAFRNVIKDESPLNISINQNGFGGEGANTAIGIGGTILYKDERSFRYQFDTQHNFLGGATPFNPFKSSQMRIEYATPERSFQAGYSGGNLGMAYQRNMEGKSYRAAIVQNLKTGATDLSGNYKTTLGRNVAGSSSLSIRSDKLAGSHSVVTDVGANISLSEHQRLTVKTTGSYGKTTHESGKVFKGAGLAYELEYDVEVGRLKVNLSNSFASKNYYGSDRGTFRIEGDAIYEVRPGSFLKVAYGKSTKRTEGVSKDGTIANLKKSNQEKLAASYNFSVGNMPFAAGATYAKTSMNNNIHSLDTTVSSATNSYGLSLGTTFKSGKNGGIQLSPSMQLGMANQDQEGKPANYNATMSLKGRIRQVTVSADYEMAMTSGGQKSALGEGKTVKERMQFAASYMYPLIADRLILNTSGEVSYDMATKEMKTGATASLDYQSGRNWTFNISANMDPLSMFSKGPGKQSTAVSVGASRSFDMPQPRLKYFNIKVQFFKDFDGNRQMDGDDEGISNILVEILRTEDPVDTVGGRPEIRFEAPSLMSDPSGKVVFHKAPQGNYLLRLDELFPPMTYTNLYGESLEVTLNRHVTILVPFTESVTIKGKVNITRDKYSRLVGVSAKNIRITITDPLGDQYYALTTATGEYIINVPYALNYKVSMKNVLGDKFELTNGEQEVQVEEDNNRYNVQFNFKEKGRSVNFGG